MIKTPHSTKQILQALVLAYLDCWPVIWSSAAKKDLLKLQLAKNRAARFGLYCNHGANINMHASLSWLSVQETLTALLLVSITNINIVCTVNLNTNTPPGIPPGVFSQSPGPEQIQGNILYYTEP